MWSPPLTLVIDDSTWEGRTRSPIDISLRDPSDDLGKSFRPKQTSYMFNGEDLSIYCVLVVSQPQLLVQGADLEVSVHDHRCTRKMKRSMFVFGHLGDMMMIFVGLPG